MMIEEESVSSLIASARAREAQRISKWLLLLRRSSSVSADKLYSKRQISHTLLPLPVAQSFGFSYVGAPEHVGAPS
jgi:hypothetical protein